ncbi:carbohydrate esterase family 4 protein [Lentinula detonsa]|uniref:chitin deacetylase n=1 Tax=Lentinula detonsa TaxID=2804962 RepID=A0AA38UNU0_9AGAR|nr:carbohydrate esterase family 4 protein [Lentinula detonsa]
MFQRLSKAFLVVSILHLRVNAQSTTADRTSEVGEAAITDPNEECSPYSYPPVDNQLSSFPAIWEAASILPNDSTAQGKWNSISASIPSNISVKTQPPASNYSSNDPDCWWTYSLCTEPKLSGLSADITAAPEPSTLGYGFDDGPNCSHNAFYDFLQSQNQKATFYYIGSNVADWPLEAQRALADGHEICAHTWSHPYMTTFTSEAAFAELWYSTEVDSFVAMQMIKLAVGVTPTCWRPPYGDVDDRIRSIAHALGLQTIMWEYDSLDSDINGNSITDQTVDTSYNNFIQTANNGTFNYTGAIFLTHELNNFTMSEAVKFYPQFKSSFQHIVPVGVSLNKTQPYVETNYSLPTFEQYISGTVTVNGTRVSPNSTSSSESSTSSDSSSSTSSATVSGNGLPTASSSNAADRLTNTGHHSILPSILFLIFYLL